MILHAQTRIKNGTIDDVFNENDSLRRQHAANGPASMQFARIRDAAGDPGGSLSSLESHERRPGAGSIIHGHGLPPRPATQILR
jgi:hypothetical protein